MGFQFPVQGRGETKPAFCTLVDLWKNALERAANDVAIRDERDCLTYHEVWMSAHALAALLEDHDCARKCVAIVSGNGAGLHVAYLAVLLIGATPALINPAYPANQIDALLGIAAPHIVLCDMVPEPTGAGEKPSGPAPQWIRLDTKSLRSAAPSRQFAAPAPEDPAVMLFTGGTTGLSKGVVHSHEAMAHAVRSMEFIWPTKATGEVWLPIAPMSHIYGFLMGVLNPVFGAGTIVVPSSFKPDLILDMIVQHRVTVFGGGPAPIFAGLLASPFLATTDLSSLAICPAGGAPTPVALLERWTRETGLQIHEAYGMTEIAPIAGSTTAAQRNGSVGRPLPFNQVEIVDTETGTRPLAAGATGEIRARGPSAMTGYLNQPGETAATLRDGWIYTGDLGHLDDDGFLYVTDRKKNMLLVKGFNVFPRIVEEALLSHEAVQAAAVIGIPDERTGERVVAFAVTDRGIGDDVLRSYLGTRLAGYMVPTEIHFVAALPMTAVNKPDKQALIAVATNART